MMLRKSKKNAVIVGVGAVAACAVCLVPLAVPAVIGVLGIGTLGAGYWLVGGALVLLAAFYVLRKLGWFKPSSRECCGPE